MCFTVEINLSREAIEQRFGARFDPKANFKPGYVVSAFEFPEMPVITGEEPDTIHTFRWGLIPSWIKDSKGAMDIRKKTLNARSETLVDKPSFRNAVKSSRCLILAHGFFEWHTRGKEKLPYYIRLKDNSVFAFAGIYDKWINPENQEEVFTFSLITTRANPLLEKIHNLKKRMPVILNPVTEEEWIKPTNKLDKALQYLQPLDDSLLKAYPVSKVVSPANPNRNSPEAIEPLS
ncbi:MAG: SOS response-associated peptidase [Bacteroidales bacterium]